MSRLVASESSNAGEHMKLVVKNTFLQFEEVDLCQRRKNRRSTTEAVFLGNSDFGNSDAETDVGSASDAFSPRSPSKQSCVSEAGSPVQLELAKLCISGSVPTVMASAAGSSCGDSDVQVVQDLVEDHYGDTKIFANTPESTPTWQGNQCFTGPRLNETFLGRYESEPSSDIEVRSDGSFVSFSGSSRSASIPQSRCSSVASDRLKVLNTSVASQTRPRFTSKTFSAVKHSDEVTEERMADLMRRIDIGGNAMHQAIWEMRGNVVQMSLEPCGSRVVQKTLERSRMLQDGQGRTIDCRLSLVAEFRGRVTELLGSRHGSSTMSEAIRQIPSTVVPFVLEEIENVEGAVAKHPFGCRVLEILINHGYGTGNLIEQLLREVNSLICNDYGIYVLMSILARQNPIYNQCIAKAIRCKTYEHAKAKKASKVVDRALVYCDDIDKQAIAMDLLADPEGLLKLTACEGGCYVAKELLISKVRCMDHRCGQTTSVGELAKSVLMNVTDAMNRLKSSKAGRKLIQELARAGISLDDLPNVEQ